MKTRTNRRVLISTLVASGVIVYGCSSKEGQDDEETAGESRPFESNMQAEPVSVAAEISTDLMEVPDVKPKKPKAPGEPGDPSDTGELEADLAAGSDEATPTEALAEGEAFVAGRKVRRREGGKVVQHKVKRGDTLMKLSFAYLGNVYRWREILADNESAIADYNALVPGTELSIRVVDAVKVRRNGRPHLIRRGDTLIRISRWIYGTMSKWRALWKNNPQLIHDPNRIYAGFKLFYAGRSIRDGVQTGPAPAAVTPETPTPPPVAVPIPPQLQVPSTTPPEGSTL